MLGGVLSGCATAENGERDPLLNSRASRAPPSLRQLSKPELAWSAFLAYFSAEKKSSPTWKKLWEDWAIRQVRFDHARPGPSKIVHAVDLTAPWLRIAEGQS